MTVRMTERDKKLLSGLGVFCVLVFFATFAIMPLHEANELLDKQMQSNREQIAEMEDKAAKLPAVRERNEAGHAALDRVQEELYPILKSQDIDRLLTEKVMSHGLSARKLQIIMPHEPANVVGYGSEDSEGSNPEYEDGVWTAVVILDASGTAASMDALVDELVTETPGVRVAGLSWLDYGKENGILQPGLEDDDDILRLQLEILMSRKD